MVWVQSPRRSGLRFAALAIALLAMLGFGLTLLHAERAKGEGLHIGTSGNLTAEKQEKEKGALESLKSFIRDETGLKNDIARHKDWRARADELANSGTHVGGCHG